MMCYSGSVRLGFLPASVRVHTLLLSSEQASIEEGDRQLGHM